METVLHPNTILNSVQSLMYLCTQDLDDVLESTRLSLLLYDALAKVHLLGTKERSYLQYAAMLQDIGVKYGEKNHHKTALKIISATTLLPFSNRERLIIGSVTRYHRKDFPNQNHDHFAALVPQDQQAVAVLAGCLRLANGLAQIPNVLLFKIKCKIKKVKIKLICQYHSQTPEIVFPILKKETRLLENIFQKEIKIFYIPKISKETP
jgi:exopolyphosphatase / guanosine-5'-triphosphate,3'-diphosphate pyrophosphatase